MFAKSQRLCKSKDILLVLRKGVRSSTDFINCSYLVKTGTLSRATVIVDKKVSKSAVARNFSKRRVRAVLRSLSLKAGDLVVRLKPGAPDLEYAQLEREVRQCLQKIR